MRTIMTKYVKWNEGPCSGFTHRPVQWMMISSINNIEKITWYLFVFIHKCMKLLQSIFAHLKWRYKNPYKLHMLNTDYC